MGARLLTRWINDPLIEILKKIYDIERIAGKVAFRKYKRERYDIIKKFYKIFTRT